MQSDLIRFSGRIDHFRQAHKSTASRHLRLRCNRAPSYLYHPTSLLMPHHSSSPTAHFARAPGLLPPPPPCPKYGMRRWISCGGAHLASFVINCRQRNVAGLHSTTTHE
ncbi:hypothetical protein EX30DRAFT_138885 [Ascodesmis nigricans]|uniref:Uncharacterized protein n=1 Tax=Ascodesmis nigricans TaxID=341454 RepID=A0A4S2N149_9PEZI|nr:hypothetical protein EX30DRAFT_138885 [Ascodesmis nigricans]